MKSDSPYIAQILENVSKIRIFIGAMPFDEFAKDELRQSAILMQLMQIGEMAKRVSEKAADEIQIPWSQIKGLRNRIVHEYYDIDIPNVWKIIAEELPKIEQPLADYIKKNPLKE